VKFKRLREILHEQGCLYDTALCRVMQLIEGLEDQEQAAKCARRLVLALIRQQQSVLSDKHRPGGLMLVELGGYEYPVRYLVEMSRDTTLTNEDIGKFLFNLIYKPSSKETGRETTSLRPRRSCSQRDR
jgi:hypothetical protein